MIDFNNLEGTTAEAGVPNENMHPFAPPTSRIKSDPFIHYVETKGSGIENIRFWFSQDLESKVLTLDFQILTPSIETDEIAMELILKIFFIEFTDNFYSTNTSIISFKNIENDKVYEREYK